MNLENIDVVLDRYLWIANNEDKEVIADSLRKMVALIDELVEKNSAGDLNENDLATSIMSKLG